MSQIEIIEEVSAKSRGINAGVIIIGSLIDLDDHGRPLVSFSENPSTKPLVALTTLSLNKSHLSRQVALLFNDGDLNQPVIMGLIHNPLDEILENFELTPDVENKKDIDPFEEDNENQIQKADIIKTEDNKVYVDGQQVCIEGSEEVTFKCGKASITLLKSGKILIRGTYLLNRSSGVNRIMGGSVQVN